MLPSQTRYGYSPINRRRHFRWPGGKGLAVYFVMGVEEYVFGEGLTEDIFPGASKPDFANTSWRDYGNRVGAIRLIDLFRAENVPLSILLNTEVYEHAPELMQHARANNCTIIGHGLTNSDTLAGRSAEDEKAYLGAVADAIERNEGKRPTGWASPWLAHSDNTADLLKATGYRYVIDLGMDDQPVWLRTETGPLLSVPYALELNDSTTMVGRLTNPSDFATMIVDQFDEMLELAEKQALVMPVVVHSFISGQPFRLRALRRALAHILAKREAIWLTTPDQIAAFIEADPKLAV
ncbi:MAG: polysaccharide deacetylase [Devosia sp.]|jgi:peptidoglycan/xylan/chitin deacetylase (PgdA/CDA1 family)|nr:polysaccharide deacetylase [Devosia sp.]